MNDLDQTPTEFRSGFVSIIGRPNVGKSTLLNAILGQKIAITSPKPQTTRNRILGIHHLPDGQILFLDTPGIHKSRGRLNKFMVDQALAACSGVDLVLLLVEAGRTPGEGEEFILELLRQGGVPVVLAINKVDLVHQLELLPLIETYAGKFPFREIVPVSARRGEGIDDLVGTLRRLLPPGPRHYPEDMVTDLPERFIVAEMIREQVLRLTREEIPYGAAVTIETFSEKPERGLVVIQAVIHVERETHKRIVVGKGGSVVRSIGQAARADIERLLGCRVFLELFIRVDRDWTESARLLREFGYD
ncbi:MAG: GTPase Era [Desulfuromonadales bacterium]|nr:GTPase Era [Desulfuromonadales bacterium]